MCERRLIEQAFSLNHAGKMLVTIIDDAHVMDMGNLRKLRLLFKDFPKNHNLILIGQPVQVVEVVLDHGACPVSALGQVIDLIVLEAASLCQLAETSR